MISSAKATTVAESSDPGAHALHRSETSPGAGLVTVNGPDTTRVSRCHHPQPLPEAGPSVPKGMAGSIGRGTTRASRSLTRCPPQGWLRGKAAGGKHPCPGKDKNAPAGKGGAGTVFAVPPGTCVAAKPPTAPRRLLLSTLLISRCGRALGCVVACGDDTTAPRPGGCARPVRARRGG